MLLVFIIILGILILVGVIVGAAMGLFRIEKVEVTEASADDFGLSETAEGEENLTDDDGLDLDDMSLKEKMDLIGYFGEDEGEVPQADKNAQENAVAESKFVQTDRISEFKVGRSYLIESQKLLNRARDEDLVYAAAYFDFDRFRFINSLKGYSIGDYVLSRLSQELPNAFPEATILTRISADHFAAIFPVTDMEMFEQLSQQLNSICDKLRGDVAIKSGLHICMGIAVTGQGGHDYDAAVLLDKANVARHCIKLSRSESCKIYESEMLSTYFYGESALDDYSENQFDDEFVIYYSPQEDVARHRMAGCDTTVRWLCEDEADKNLPVYLQKNKIPTNSSKVIYQVCKAMSRWRKAGRQVLPVSVSMPIIQLIKEDIDAFVAKCLQEFQLEPSMLCIVIEASIVRVDWSVVSHQLKKIRDIGVKIGIDEIDTAYSSLDFLSGLPISFVKLHRGFVVDIDKSEERRAKASQMLQMTKALNLRALFDGVENLEQANSIRALGPAWVQGGYCGKALKPDDVAAILPQFVEKQKYDSTVIIEDAALSKGDFNVF